MVRALDFYPGGPGLNPIWDVGFFSSYVSLLVTNFHIRKKVETKKCRFSFGSVEGLLPVIIIMSFMPVYIVSLKNRLAILVYLVEFGRFLRTSASPLKSHSVRSVFI